MSIISTDISKAVDLLTKEQLVAIPTETVYGLAGNIFSKKAIQAIFQTKKRPLFNPLIVHIPSVDALETVAKDIPEQAKKLARAFWPGSLTLVLKKQDNIPSLITAGKDTVAVRVPNHPTTIKLLNALDFPLAAPSANPFGSISPTQAQHVANYFEKDIQMVLDGGPCANGIESTIVGFENNGPIIYRLGSISIEDIEAVIGSIQIKNKKDVAPDAPGMLARHYAPATKTLLTDHVLETILQHAGKKIGVLVFQNVLKEQNIAHQIVLSEHGDFQEAASNLYKSMHELDQLNLDIIIAERLPDTGLGRSVNDRLQRATF